MKCPECIAEGKKSMVYPGISVKSAVYYPSFYDTDGKMHTHDGNTVTTNYTCSEGHEWTERTTGSCWCGWPDA